MAKYFINKKMNKTEKKNAIINAIDCAYGIAARGDMGVFFLTRDYFVFSEDGNKVELIYCIPGTEDKFEMVMAFSRKYNYLTDIADTISAYIG